jgi:hypothetical protein
MVMVLLSGSIMTQPAGPKPPADVDGAEVGQAGQA